MKKTIALMLSLMLTMGLLAGCSSSQPSSSTPSSDVPAEVLGVTVKAGGKLEGILANGKMTMVMSPKYAPYEFIDLTNTTGGQEKYVGADIELGKYIAEKLGVELVIDEMDFNGCLAAITESKVDLAISGIGAKEERKEKMDFSDPYNPGATNVVLILKDNAEKFKTIDDLNKAEVKLAVQNASIQQSAAEKVLPNASLEIVSTPGDGIAELLNGKLDGIVCAGPSAAGFITRYDNLQTCEEDLGVTSSGMAIAVPKGNEDFVEVLNLIIQEVNDQGLFAQWVLDAQDLSASQQSLQSSSK